FGVAGFFEGILVFNALALLACLWVLARLIQRTALPQMTAVSLVAVPVIFASAGSLPFFAAFLMPDLLAAVLLVTAALVTAYWRDMSWLELAIVGAVGVITVVSHLSHLAIAALLVLGAVLLCGLFARRGWWVAPLFLCFLVAVGWGQQLAFRIVAEKVTSSEVVIRPFLTARLIQDGPGYRWLEENCPEAAIPTCKLWTALQKSDDPYRLTASHITFETSERLGSYRLMAQEDRKDVADTQVQFFLTVLRDKPVAVVGALLKNTLTQAGWASVDMTLPTDKILAANSTMHGTISGVPEHGRLSRDTGWVDGFTRLQETYYVAALALILVLLVSPSALPASLRIFAGMMLLGLLANAFVCGGISQPATRYGARVIWLLPLLAALMLIVASRQKEQA
ncbi:MAG: hypothetical protein WBA91_12125, partial [Paracoccaceae bacterium]